MSVIEIRPGIPDDMHCFRGLPDREPGLDRCRLVLDRSAGTATWIGDGYRVRRVEMRIGPGSGELAGVVRAVYPSSLYRAGLWGRLFLVDGTGRVLARSLLAPQDVLEQFWPLSAFDGTGLTVRAEEFRNTRLAHKAYPGAVPTWPFNAGVGWSYLSLSVLGAAPWGVMALVALMADGPA